MYAFVKSRGVATGWTGVETFTPLFLEGVCGIESLWSVLISFRLYPRPAPYLGGDTPPHTLSILFSVHPTLFDLATPLVTSVCDSYMALIANRCEVTSFTCIGCCS